MMDKKREKDAGLKALKPDMDKSAEAIGSTISQKAFIIDQKKEKAIGSTISQKLNFLENYNTKQL